MRIDRFFCGVLAGGLMAAMMSGATTEEAMGPRSLAQARIRMSVNLFGTLIGPYGVSEEGKRTLEIYEGEPVRFILTMRHGGSYEVPIFREDGKLKNQIEVTLRKGGKAKTCDFDSAAEPSRADSRGREVSGLDSLKPGESLQSLWKLTSELESGDYELIVGFAADGEYGGKDTWKREMRPINFTVKKVESEEDKLNVLFRRGASLFAQGETDAAITELRNLLSVHPNCAFAYEYLGHCHRGRKDREEAVKMYEKAMEIIREDQDEKIRLSQYEKADSLDFLESLRDAAENDK